jgi:leucyl/phenylalanyl-tRNA--protein transferase
MGQLFLANRCSAAPTTPPNGFATLVQHLKEAGFVLIDCQMPTDHLHSLGARAIPRHEFANYLARHLDQSSRATWVC